MSTTDRTYVNTNKSQMGIYSTEPIIPDRTVQLFLSQIHVGTIASMRM